MSPGATIVLYSVTTLYGNIQIKPEYIIYFDPHVHQLAYQNLLA